jgi:hypothetical protein
MKWILCLALGHQKTLMPFSSNRFVCRRCGADLGSESPTLPPPVLTLSTHPEQREKTRGLQSALPTPRMPARTHVARHRRNSFLPRHPRAS